MKIFFKPYAQDAANHLYNLLFCDDSSAFAPRDGAKPAPWQVTLFAEPLVAGELTQLAEDTAMDARIRALACHRLRANGLPVRPKQLLGVIVEVPLERGLDTLAAFAEGGVRYINQTGRLSIFEAVPDLQPAVASLFRAAEAVVARIGPWDKPRLPPPKAGNIRLTFLVSDGLYFGEGPMTAMQRETLAGPVIHHAGELLQRVVAMASK